MQYGIAEVDKKSRLSQRWMNIQTRKSRPSTSQLRWHITVSSEYRQEGKPPTTIFVGLLSFLCRVNTDIYCLVWLSPVAAPALNFAGLIRRYVRPFTKHDAQHALQYVACICLSSDQGTGIGKEQVEYAWSEVRKIVVLAEGGGWDELVGGSRPDGTHFVSIR